MPMEIVLNKESQRKTPSVLSIRNNERYLFVRFCKMGFVMKMYVYYENVPYASLKLFGDAAQAIVSRYPASVYGHLLDLVAKHADHPSVVLFRERFPQLRMEKHENTSTIVFPIGDTVYSIETLLAMILTNVREFTEAYAEMAIRDVVISIPIFFTHAERLAIEKATEIAKLNLLQLINDGTAAGLNYGMFRRKEITEKQQRLLIYDMGSAKTVATIVEYKLVKTKYGKEPKMSVLGVGFDRRLGGLEMTMRLRDHLVKKFIENYNPQKDITTNERAMAKLFKEAERLKQVLSANLDHFAQIESLHEEIDMRVQVTREEFNRLIDDLLTRLIDQVVLMGAGTRVPKVQEELQRFIKGKELGRFLNTDEAIAMGALYQAAHLSKGFKVKPFIVEELIIFPVQVSFISKQKQENGDIVDKPITRHVFQFKSKYPTNKKYIFREFDSLLPQLSRISVFGVAKALENELKPDETEFVGVKIGFLVDLSGVLRIEKAEAVIKRKTITKTITGFFSKKAEEGEPTDSEDRKDNEIGEAVDDAESSQSTDKKLPGTDGKPLNDVVEEGDKKDGNEKEKKLDGKKEDEAQGDMKLESEGGIGDKMEGNVSTEQNKENTTSEPFTKEKGKTPEVVRVVLKTKEEYPTVPLLTKDDVSAAKKILEQFEKRERNARERAVAVNELESYTFDVSQFIEEEEYIKHSTETERKLLQEEIKRIRIWLEDDVTMETNVAEFTKNHVALKTLVKPLKRRVDEAKVGLSL
uniref:Hypoxia up-regulated protein 1 n=1 Tax=Angiostrongylus cantonensis TaxID=6313 RepID=A0A0K0CVF7_ANGCA